jgi:exonuclease SbcD
MVLPREAMTRLRRRFARAACLLHEPPAVPVDRRTYRDRVAGRGDLELVADFVAHVTGTPAASDDLAVCSEVVDEVNAAVA